MGRYGWMPFVASTMAALIGSCARGDNESARYNAVKGERVYEGRAAKSAASQRYFTDWNQVERVLRADRALYPKEARIEHVDVELADLDGDGDLDLLVLSGRSRVRVYENRIPRKK